MVINHNRVSKPIWRSDLNLYQVTFLAGRIDYNESELTNRQGLLDEYLEVRFNKTEIGTWCIENNIKAEIKENDVLKLWFKNFKVIGLLTKKQTVEYILRFSDAKFKSTAEWCDDDPYGYPNEQHDNRIHSDDAISGGINMPISSPCK
jgi:hypothetical protein